MDLTALYCDVDDFWKSFKQEWDKHLIDYGKKKRGPESKLSISEMIRAVGDTPFTPGYKEQFAFREIIGCHVKEIIREEVPTSWDMIIHA